VQVNEPGDLIAGFEEKHLEMIKAMRGVPGVLPERLAEASKSVKHCALSLVGEPIIYPRINEMLTGLHRKGISTFMVTNAQFPDEMESLVPVTQLYISIDAPTPEELKAVDRPLFSDFWERFLECVDQLRVKRQRTVFRLTLVNGWNTQALSKYVQLVRRGGPDFIEVKGVTYCGDSTASPLTIKHCPYHAEVRAYCKAMVAELGEGYELASEHAHSNIVLIARKEFKREGVWHTWIDYDRFTALANSGQPFGAEDYCAPTPEWATYQEDAADGGFDPNETRFVRKGGNQVVTGGGC
jgi:tRNA wybutosine-synthesizing protein 1